MHTPARAPTPAIKLAQLAKNTFPGESDAYQTARRALPVEEIEFRRQIARVAAQRCAMSPEGQRRVT